MHDSDYSGVPHVSVIIPVYNGEAFVKNAIDSVLMQTGVSFEVIIGDNASKDNTLEILSQYAADARIRVMTNSENLGIYGNLNKLVSYAKSDLIKILCADDRLLPSGLAAQVGYMNANPDLGFSRCKCVGHSADHKIKGPYRYENRLPEIINKKVSALVFFTFGNLPGSLTNVICRKHALVDCGPFDQSYPYAGDYEMWVRLGSKYSFGLQDVECVYVQQHGQQSSVTLNKHNELISQIDKIMENLFERIPSECRKLGRYHASVTVVVGHVSHTIRRLLERKWPAFRPYAVKRRYAYAWPVCFVLYFLTFGMRLGYHLSTKRLLRRIHVGAA